MAEDSRELPRIIEQDPWLEQAAGDIIARHDRFVAKLGLIEGFSGTIEQFASAYEYLGIHFIKIGRAHV